MKHLPNILFLMADQMQGCVLEPGHPCQTPNLNRLAARGVRIQRAYTPNAICSPARASLMTGLLPHNHGVLWVTHNVDSDQSRLRPDKPHWAQQLAAAGYQTGYFGKWHIDHDNDLTRYGWQVDGSIASSGYQALAASCRQSRNTPERYQLRRDQDMPPGYPCSIHYGVVEAARPDRSMDVVTDLAMSYLDKCVEHNQPWCCFASYEEPHDPFITTRLAFEQYDLDTLPNDPTWRDPMHDRPNLYRKQARLWRDRTDRELKEAAACYYASITELDQRFGRLLDRVERAGQLDNTIVVLTSDHGELLGSHGLYCKNVSAFEPVYHIPMLLAGPGIRRGEACEARVGLHDLCPTLLELTGVASIPRLNARSFASVLDNPADNTDRFQAGYAEYFGSRYVFTQRIVWDGEWKYVHNGFDFDELYNLERDPQELRNLVDFDEHQAILQHMQGLMWQRIRETGDHTLLNTNYPILRMASCGPYPEREGVGLNHTGEQMHFAGQGPITIAP